MELIPPKLEVWRYYVENCTTILTQPILSDPPVWRTMLWRRPCMPVAVIVPSYRIVNVQVSVMGLQLS